MATEARMPLPPEYVEFQEIVEDWMLWFVDAFLELSTERSIGMSLGPIPWSKVREYGIHHGFSGSQLNDFHTIIRRMDDVYLKSKPGGKS